MSRMSLWSSTMMLSWLVTTTLKRGIWVVRERRVASLVAATLWISSRTDCQVAAHAALSFERYSLKE